MADELPDFRDPEAFEAWLRDRPSIYSTLLAARMALRLLPLWSRSQTEVHNASSNLALDVAFRAVSASWLASGPFKEADEGLLLGAVSGAFHSDISAVNRAGDALCAAYFATKAALSALDPNGHPNRAARAATNGIFGIARWDDNARWNNDDLWIEGGPPGEINQILFSELQKDAIDLMGSFDKAALYTASLWFYESSERFEIEVDAWRSLRAHLSRRADEGWKVWIDWYESKLHGDRPDWEREHAYVLDLERFWKQGPAAANAEIARRLAEIDARRRAEAERDRLLDDAALGEIVYDALRSEFRIQPRTTEVPRLPSAQDVADYGHKLEALAFAAAALAEDVARDFPDAGRGFSAQLNRFAALLAGATPERLNPDLFFEFGQGVLDLHADPDIHDALPEVFAKRFDRLVAVLLEFGEAFYADVQARRAKVDELRPPNEGDAGPIATEAVETPARLVAEVPDLPPLNEDDRRWLEALAEEVRDRGVAMLRLDDARREAERTALFRLARRIVATVAKYVEKAEDRVSEMPEGVRHSLYASAAYEALKKLIQTLF